MQNYLVKIRLQQCWLLQFQGSLGSMIRNSKIQWSSINPSSFKEPAQTLCVLANMYWFICTRYSHCKFKWFQSEIVNPTIKPLYGCRDCCSCKLLSCVESSHIFLFMWVSPLYVLHYVTWPRLLQSSRTLWQLLPSYHGKLSKHVHSCTGIGVGSGTWTSFIVC